MLDQNHAALELLVIDNASTDGTAEIVRGFSSIRYFYLEEKGLANALNHGVERSQDAFLGFLDADDLWIQNKLATQLERFAANPSLDMVFGHIEQFLSPELEGPVKQRLRIRRKELPGYVKSSMLIRKESFWRVGLFDKSMEFADFIDWYMRAQEENLQELMLPDVLTLRRIHETNMGYTERNQRIDYARVHKRSLDRRRRLSKT